MHRVLVHVIASMSDFQHTWAVAGPFVYYDCVQSAEHHAALSSLPSSDCTQHRVTGALSSSFRHSLSCLCVQLFPCPIPLLLVQMAPAVVLCLFLLCLCWLMLMTLCFIFSCVLCFSTRCSYTELWRNCPVCFSKFVHFFTSVWCHFLVHCVSKSRLTYKAKLEQHSLTAKFQNVCFPDLPFFYVLLHCFFLWVFL